MKIVVMSPVIRKPVFGISEQIRHKPGGTATEDSKRLEILDLEKEGLYHLHRKKRGADQLRNYCAAYLRLCFRMCKHPVFSRRGKILLFSLFICNAKMQRIKKGSKKKSKRKRERRTSCKNVLIWK